MRKLSEKYIANPKLYTKQGKQRKNMMRCKDASYIKEVKRWNGTYNYQWACAGMSCPFYSIGCNKYE